MRAVLAVALGRGHERLDPAELDPLLVVEDGAEERLVALQHLLHALGILRVEGLEPALQPLDVDPDRR